MTGSPMARNLLLGELFKASFDRKVTPAAETSSSSSTWKSTLDSSYRSSPVDMSNRFAARKVNGSTLAELVASVDYPGTGSATTGSFAVGSPGSLWM